MADKKKGIFARIIGWFKRRADWIQEHLGDPAIARSLREDLGLAPGAQIEEDKTAKFRQFATGLDPDKEAFSETIAELAPMVTELKALSAALATDHMPAGQVSYLLLTLATTDSIRLRLPWLYAFSRAVLFFEEDTEALILLDPKRLLRNLRGEDLPEGEVLAQRISAAGGLALQLLDLFTSKEKAGDQTGHVDIVYGWDLSPDSVTPLADLVSLRATTFSIGRAAPDEHGLDQRLLVTVLAVPTAHGGPGLFLSLGGALTVTRDFDEGRTQFRFDAGFPSAFDLYVPFPGSGMALTANGGGTLPFLKFGIVAGQPDEPALRIGEAGKTQFDIYKLDFGIDIAKDDAGVHAALRDAELVIVPGDGDSFLRKVMGDGAKLRFSVGLVADGDGFRLDGGTKANATIPIARAIAGVLTVHHLEIALGPSSSGGDLGLALGGAFTAKLGPFVATVDRLGFRLDLDFKDDASGNLNETDLAFGFLPPAGLGLELDSRYIKGGGYLFSDPAAHEYAGALELAFGKLGIKAIGMLSTRPDDWSLLLMIYSSFPPWHFAFDFTLNGVGGLIGIQHGVDVTALAAGMRTKAFDDILFPADPIADAPRIINRLRTLFPPTPRALTLGLMFDIGWGTPRFVFIRLGVIVQFDNVFGAGPDSSFSRAVLVGQLKVALGPTKEDATITLVKLVVDILGFWDVEKKRYGFLARLRDSKIATVDITGALGVWGDYGEAPRYLLAAGGFNPRFKDVPAEVAGVMDRLGAAFKVGRFELKMAGYFALTPGTIQAGLVFAATAKIGPVGLKGELGFDVLIYRVPKTYFIADFHIIAEVSYKGHTLAGVKVTGTLEGPGLWHIVGKVTFSILWWDISKSFDESWGDTAAVLTVSTDVQGLLSAELAKRENWTAQLPVGLEAMVTLAADAADLATRAHPLGRFLFSQRVVPLGLELEKFGDTGVAGPNRFDLGTVTIGGSPVADAAPVREHFARAQFVRTSEDARLASPSFEAMEAGVAFSAETFNVGAGGLAVDLDYETAYLDLDPRRFNRVRYATLAAVFDHAFVGAMAQHGAAGRAPQRADERMRARTHAQLSIMPAPLAAADTSSFRTGAVVLDGQARTVEMIAEQQLRATAGAELVEAFELEPA